MIRCDVLFYSVDNSGTGNGRRGIPMYCSHPAEFRLVGAVDFTGGTCFVCTEHVDVFQCLRKIPLDDWYIEQAELHLTE